ncbi:ABC transporter permease subunit [Aquabacter cavernae]|uniref:branched-chain amino acid ABC transporter ATP-binding protein/permease n=1 Tax=Aquabacter cavernae TaxID=2496029 RepID=UPI000F8D8C2F|nr:ATP-binding cassette domain-containing protein [Aquabacter cavernae]
MGTGSLEAFATIQLIYLIAALGHYMPLSMKQLDVGIAGYFALGAYVSALLTRDWGVPFELALLAGTLAGALGAVVVDALATRVRLAGFAYAIFSLSFAEALRIILNNVSAVGGSGGLVGIPAHTTLPLVAGLALVILVGFWLFDRARLGQLKTAIGDDELIVPVMGVPLVATKLTIFAMGGGLGGLAGGLYSHYVLFIRPDDFGFALLISLQLPIVFGGLDRFYGAVAGILILGCVPEMVRGLADYRLLFMGAATLAVLAVRPSGLITHATVATVKRWLGLPSGGAPRRAVTGVPAPTVATAAGPLVVDGICVRFGGIAALDGVGMTIPTTPGISAVIGPNGAGKTTFFNVLTGLIRPQAGQIRLEGRDLVGLRPDQVFKARIARTFQGVRLFSHLCVYRNVMLAARSATPDGALARARAERALAAAGLDQAAWGLPPDRLTLLDRRLVEIARGLAARPVVLLLDEPAAGLNSAEKERLGALLGHLAEAFACRIVIVEHDMKLVMSIAETVWVMNFGRVLSHGTPEEIRNDPAVIEAYLGSEAAHA